MREILSRHLPLGVHLYGHEMKSFIDVVTQRKGRREQQNSNCSENGERYSDAINVGPNKCIDTRFRPQAAVDDFWLLQSVEDLRSVLS